MSETLQQPQNFELIDHVPNFSVPEVDRGDSEELTSVIELNNGESFSLSLDETEEIIPSEDLFYQTGIHGRMIAEINTSSDPRNSNVLAIIDGRDSSAYSARDRHFLWSEKDGDRAQSFSSDVILVQLKKTEAANGTVSYDVIRTSGKGIVGTGLTEEVAIGRGGGNKLVQERGFAFDATTSRSHLSVGYDSESGKISFKDLSFKNGSNLEYQKRKDGNEKRVNDTETIPVIKSAGEIATLEEIKIGVETEYKIGNLTAELEGSSNIGGREAYVFKTTDEGGRQRSMFVYQSQSEGSWRVSQGVDIDDRDRFMKGAELSRFSQYTQDTQLHPEFESILESVRGLSFTSPGAVPKVTGDDMRIGREKVDELAEDFEENVGVFQLGNIDLHTELFRVQNGTLSEANVKAQLGLSAEASTLEAQEALKKYVVSLNEMLENSDVIPDFSLSPTKVVESDHPLLGAVKKESFIKNVKGRPVEWVIGSSKTGDTWVERIRLADTDPSVYGTDKEMLYSGILTAKPLEYRKQATAIPDSQKKDVNGSYVNICDFLEGLAPIKKYKQNRT